MKSPIVQKHTQVAREVGMELSTAVRERWGEEFMKYHFESLKTNILVRLAENPIKIVCALQHAVTSKSPCIRYRPGWQSKFVYFRLSIVPACLTDFYYAKTRSLPVLPAGVTKQLKP
ncbi:unnamed protein product [Rotaria sordida]|uniref:Uncharacterized protein n=1 Tax=Rotaria sordida TaxID=392033 RepID=A0A820CFX7_9BILA|nr:unnamed protein product [Rotaria sordida]CAF4221714.1 unnamed protein product [Rotaria sordida]